MSQRKTVEDFFNEMPSLDAGAEDHFIVRNTDVISTLKSFAKQEVEARDELIKEMMEALIAINKGVDNILIPANINNSEILTQIRKLFKDALTKAQSFNQE